MKIILAPMQGLTELLFRRAYSHCFPNAIDEAVSPFLSLTHGNLADSWKKIGDVLPEANAGSLPVVPQILGNEPDEFVALANRLHEVGYEEVNWNIGCPVRRVAHKHRGSGILPYPHEVEHVLQSIVPQLRPRLSVKMRLGYHDATEIDALIPILNRYPIKSVTLHPRIGKQLYGGRADMEAFARAAAQIRHPVIYNGDIVGIEDFRRLQQHLPHSDSLMIGRGILLNPTLPLQIKEACGMPGCLSQDEGRQRTILLMQTLLDDIDRTLPTAQAKMRKSKEYWCLMHRACHATEEEKMRVLHCEDFASARRAIQEIIK